MESKDVPGQLGDAKATAASQAGATQLSQDQASAYNALDPMAETSQRPWEYEVQSRRLRVIGYVGAAALIVIHIIMGIVVGIGSTGVTITTIDRFAFPGIGVILAVLCAVCLSRPRVRANADGVEVRNFIGTRFYGWSVIYGLSFPRGSRVARLELPDFEYVPMWALQAADQDTILEDVERFRQLEAAYMPED